MLLVSVPCNGFEAGGANACNREQFDEQISQKSIRLLPEIINFQEKLPANKNVAIGAGEMNTVRVLDGACFLEVAVYVDHKTRFELWHIFLLDRDYVVRGVMNIEGNFISLEEWRR
jgi:hypothetical protein